jgi:transposase
MFNCNVIAIDLAKNLFQVCKTDKNGKVIITKQPPELSLRNC